MNSLTADILRVVHGAVPCQRTETLELLRPPPHLYFCPYCATARILTLIFDIQRVRQGRCALKAAHSAATHLARTQTDA